MIDVPSDVRLEIELALRVCLGGVFLLAGVSKLRSPRAFANSVASYDLLPSRVAKVFAIFLIPAELVAGLALTTGWLGHISEALALVVLVLFAIAVSTNLRRHRVIPCGCFGNEEEVISNRTMVRLLLLGVGVLSLAFLSVSGLTPWAYASTDTEFLIESLLLAAALATFTSWLLRAPDVLSAVGIRSVRRDVQLLQGMEDQ